MVCLGAGALGAAGFNARVFDDNLSQIFWLTRTAIGCRVVVPDQELADAKQALHDLESGVNQIEPDPSEAPPPRSKKLIFAIWSFLIGA